MEKTKGKLQRRLKQHMSILCKHIGERHLGSRGETTAATYIYQQLQQLDYDMQSETFNAPGWRYGSYRLSLSGNGAKFPCFPCYYSHSCNIRGRLVPLNIQDVYKAPAQTVSGKICFVHGDFPGVIGTNALAKRLERRGARALIITSPYQNTISTKIVREPALKHLAVATVSKDTALDIARYMDRTFTLKISAQNFPVKSRNIIGRRKGTGAGVVIIGAHYDTAPGIVGARDNAAGIAALLEIARILRNQTYEDTIEIIAFAGEEYGGSMGFGLGSWVYTERHRSKLCNAKWMGCLDGIGGLLGKGTALISKASKKIYNAVSQVSAEFGIEIRNKCGSDSAAFHRLGIPTIWFHDDEPDSGNGHVPLHSPVDNLDVIDWTRLTTMTVCAARTFKNLLNIK